MGNVMKIDGRTENFDRAKIERSIRLAGADENVAKEIANIIPDVAAPTTNGIREIVTEELRKRDADAAKRYEETRQLIAKRAVDAAKGTARLTEDTMHRLNLSPGDPIELRFANKTHSVKTEKGASNTKNIQLTEEDLKIIGAAEGTRIAVRRVR